MKKIFYLFFLLILCCPCFGQSGNTWAVTGDFAAGERERAVGFSLLGRGYVACGLDSADVVRNDLWEFDPATATWTQKASMPGVGRRNPVSFVIDDYAYVGTGMSHASAPLGNTLRDFWKYDPINNTWSAIPDYPGGFNNGVYFATAFSLDGKGYVCGGKLGPDTYTADMYEYKPSANQWGQRASFPGGPRYQLGSVVSSNKAYVGLGTDEDVHLKDWWEYHPGTNIWTKKNDFPAAERSNIISFTINGRPHIGMGGDGGYKDDLWEYMPDTDTWQIRRNFPKPGRRYASCFTIANRAYVGIGKAESGSKRSFLVYVPWEAN